MKLGTFAKVAALATATTMLLVGCSGAAAEDAAPSSEPTSAARGELLTLAARVEVKSYDPAQAHVGHSLIWYQAVYDTLIMRAPDGTLSPMLATEWAYNDDKTVLTLDLRGGVTFSDGEPFDAAAVVANVENFQAANGPQASQLRSVETATAVDEDTVELQLSAPDPALEYYLSQAAGFMGSPAALGTESIIREPVGTGPYELVLEETVAGSQYAYTAREDYWNPELQHWDELVLKPATDFTAVVNGLVGGQYDAGMLEPQTAVLADQSGLTLVPNEVDWQGLAFFDRDGTMVPALADVRVRQAINYAIDRETLLEAILDGRGTATEQILAPDSDGYVAELEGAYAYDPERARELLAEAGYADGFALQVPTGNGFESILAALTQQFADVGITLEQIPTPQETLTAEIRDGKFPAAVFNFAMSATPWISANYLLTPEATYNTHGTVDEELIGLIGELHAAGDDATEPAQAITRHIVEQAWFAPLYRVEQPYYADAEHVSVEVTRNQAAPSLYGYTPVR